MPNWCQNDLTVNGKPAEVEQFLNFMRTEEADEQGKVHQRLFDFNRLIPMPPELKITAGSSEIAYEASYGSEEEVAYRLSWPWVVKKGITSRAELVAYCDKEYPGLAEQYKSNKDKHSHTQWYDWAIAKWGTKWNADEVNIRLSATGRAAYLRFDTAWSPPEPVIAAASAQFPKLTFTLRYREEGVGFRGILKMKAGASLPRDYQEAA